MLRYLRLQLFLSLVRRFSPAVRRRRMRKMMAIFNLPAGSKVIDLGGVSRIWNFVEIPLNITIVNLPGSYKGEDLDTHHQFTYLEGDATSLPNLQDGSFDLVFSNSVIEHVGDTERQRMFAGEVRRLAAYYFIQTPAIWFPLEAHTGVPFWWFLPNWIKARLHRRWSRILPAWNDMVLGTTVISKRALQSFFPDGSLLTERAFLIPKCYCVFRKST